MPLFTWNDSYSVKVALCDAQHKKLFDLINQLADAMRAGVGQEIVARIIGQLMLYTRTHFQQEEALLRKSLYPQLAAHQEQHRKFVADVEALDRQLREGRGADTVRVLMMLRDWLLNHILKTDQNYSAHLNAAGIF
ncbi:MAG TPA: bacteriohemerythrin [Acidobacteriaceae bacterium]|jgi:hemerythrin|nr:bacteriohemerythrin [Acidobacteriaceae bacterium]